MDLYMLILRLIHIGSGVVWAGGAITAARFIEPASRDAGDAGPRFMAALLRQNFPTVMGVTGGLTLLSGALMWWRDTAGLANQWVTTGPGLTFTIGAVFGIVGLTVGFAIMTPASIKMKALGAAVAQAGGKPTPEQGAEMAQTSARLAQAGRINALALAIAVICMGTAQYIP